jgi:hypothetical protein
LLKLTHLGGFAAGAADVRPNAVNFTDISVLDNPASGATNVVTFTGIDVTIALRLSLSSNMSFDNIVDVFRDGSPVAQGTSGATIDVSVANNQTLQFTFTNTMPVTTWSGTATLTNLTDANAVLDTFTYALTHIGGGGGGGGEGPPP